MSWQNSSPSRNWNNGARNQPNSYPGRGGARGRRGGGAVPRGALPGVTGSLPGTGGAPARLPRQGYDPSTGELYPSGTFEHQPSVNPVRLDLPGLQPDGGAGAGGQVSYRDAAAGQHAPVITTSNPVVSDITAVQRPPTGGLLVQHQPAYNIGAGQNNPGGQSEAVGAGAPVGADAHQARAGLPSGGALVPQQRVHPGADVGLRDGPSGGPDSTAPASGNRQNHAGVSIGTPLRTCLLFCLVLKLCTIIYSTLHYLY